MSRLIDVQPSVSEKPKKVDVEKVLQGLKCCCAEDRECAHCPYMVNVFHCRKNLTKDALEVIEQLRTASGKR